MKGFTVIYPTLIRGEDFGDEFEKTAKDVTEHIRIDFEEATERWSHPPVFEEEVESHIGSIDFGVTTESEIFKFVDEGTIPHIIIPVNAKVLHWVNDKGEDVFSKKVNHPGYKGKQITKRLYEKWSDMMKFFFEDAMTRATEASGHQM